MCVAVRLAVAGLDHCSHQSRTERKKGEKRDKREEWETNHRQIRSKEKIECAKERVCVRERKGDGEEETREYSGSPPSQKQQEQHSNPHLLFLFILQSLFFQFPPPMSVGVAGN